MVKNKKEELGNIIMVKLVSPRKSARHKHREENNKKKKFRLGLENTEKKGF